MAAKQLSEMTPEELWRLFPIEIRPYDTVYPERFKRERDSLLALVRGCGVVRVSHIGSTAVPGLAAKPIVDILLEVGADADVDTLKSRLCAEWICMRDVRTPLRVSFNKGYTPLGFAGEVYHLHVVRAGDCGELYFRDWLIEHPDTAATYAALKLSLAGRYRYDRDGYTAAKSDFVRAYTEKAVRLYGARYRAK